MSCGTVLVIGAAIALTGCAEMDAPGATIPDGRVSLAPIDPSDVLTPEELESLGYTGDGMTIEHHDLTTNVSEHYGEDPRFSGFEWDRTEGVLRLWWFDGVPPRLTEMLNASSVAIEVAPTAHSPAELRAAAQRLISPGAIPGLFVTSTATAIDCSKLDVTVEAIPPGMTEADVTAALTELAGFPVDFTIESFIPISGSVQ